MLYPVERRRERAASNNISRDNDILLLVAAFYTPILSIWEGPCCCSGHMMGSKYCPLT